MLFNEPKLLKFSGDSGELLWLPSFSALQRAEIAEIRDARIAPPASTSVSVLFNEPKLLKFVDYVAYASIVQRFSALQRAEIAEMTNEPSQDTSSPSFSALQRAEIAEMGINDAKSQS